MKKEGLIALLLILTISITSASFLIGNASHFIDKEYAPLGNVKGWINMSFNNEPSDSSFIDSENNSISLIELLNKSQGAVYNCSTIGCLSDFSATNPQEVKDSLILEGVSKRFGFKLNGKILEIKSFAFTAISNATSSCNNQLKIDFLDDKTFELGNNKASTEICSGLQNYGCYNTSESTNNKILGTTPYCQKINLNESAGFNVGAWIKKEGSGSQDLKMLLIDGEHQETCNLPPATTTGGELFCSLTYLVTSQKDLYICVFAGAEPTATLKYETKSNSAPANLCGIYGLPKSWKTPTTAYHIFAQPRKFASVGNLQITDILPNEESLVLMLEAYIAQKYPNAQCPNDGCIIPMGILSGADQLVSIRNIDFIYKDTSGLTSTSVIWDLIEGPTKINSGFQNIYLDDASFSLPSSLDNITYALDLEGQNIFTETLSIGSVPIINDVNPKIAALGYNTKFKVYVYSSGSNITRYIWKFDNTTRITTKNEVEYTFENLGLHDLTITIESSNNKTNVKSFQINVSTPESKINQDLIKIKRDLEKIKTKIETYPQFYQTGLEEVLGLDSAEDNLKDIERRYNVSSTQEDFLIIINDLNKFQLPDSILTTNLATLIPFFPQKENIDFEIVDSIGLGTWDAEKKEEYLIALLGWNQENMETKITFEEISASKGGIENSIFKVITLHLNEIIEQTDSPYLIIEKLENLRFKEDYGEEGEEGENYIYIELDPSIDTIVFSTTADIDFIDLPAFISPEISELHLTERPNINGKEKGWTFFILIVAFLVLLGFIIYIILQQWYKNKYENYLFKNRNNLLNLLTYINNQKKRGLEDKEIIKKLKGARWKSEQISYAMKKYAGKRTGMLEIIKLGKTHPKTMPQPGRFGQNPIYFPPRKF